MSFLLILLPFLQNLYEMSGTVNKILLVIGRVVFCPDITEVVDWTLKKQLTTYLPTYQKRLMTLL